MTLSAMIREGLALTSLFLVLILWSIMGHAVVG
jgi:hypothetical protein